jgi:hypothetical protein
MNLEQALQPNVQIVYQEALPSDTAEFKESHSRMESTLARAHAMRMKALLEGKLLTLKSKAHLKECQEHFKEPIRTPKEGIPKMKLSFLRWLARKADELNG